MNLNTLIERIKRRKVNADQVCRAAILDYCHNSWRDTLTAELSLFKYYLMLLDTIEPINDEEREMISSAKKEISLVLVSLESAPLRIKIGVSSAVLLVAAKHNDEELLSTTLEVNSQMSRRSLSEALMATIKNKNCKLAAQLIEAGANINLEVGLSQVVLSTPLIEAVKKNDLEMVKLLIAYGADINQNVAGTGTALFRACSSYVSLELFQFLLSCPNVNPDIKPSCCYAKTVFSELLSDIRCSHPNNMSKLACLLKAPHTKEPRNLSMALSAGINVIKLFLEAGYVCTNDILNEGIISQDAEVIALMNFQNLVDQEENLLAQISKTLDDTTSEQLINALHEVFRKMLSFSGASFLPSREILETLFDRKLRFAQTERSTLQSNSIFSPEKPLEPAVDELQINKASSNNLR